MDESGAKLALASRSTETLKKLDEKLKSQSMIVEMDVANNESIENGFSRIMEHYGKVDVLVNSAGIMPLSYLKNLHLTEWLNTVEVNVKGILRCIHGALPSMKERKSGHIINIASVDGNEPYEGGAIYGASTAAINTLSQAMRMELSPEFNIKVTSIEPGTVDTDLREDITDEDLLEEKDYGGDEPKLNPFDIARAVGYAVGEPDRVNVNELVVKPTGKS